MNIAATPPLHNSDSPPPSHSQSPQSLLFTDLHTLPPSLYVPPSPHAFAHPSTDSVEEPFGTVIRTNGAFNGELDLLPCTLDQYLKLSEYTTAKYELIDNHLFFKRDMDDPEAGLIRQSLSYKLRELFADGQAEICVNEVGNVHLPGASFSSSPPASRTTSPSSSSIEPTAPSASSSVLVPDITITPFSPRQSPNRRSPRSAAFVASYTKQSPFMHIEITSQQSSRRTDFTTKWVKYAQAGVDEYVIIDRDKPHAPRPGSRASPLWRPCVVVGKRNGPGPFRTTGYPTTTLNGAPRRSGRLAARSSSQSQAGYHWQIFEGNTPIDCTYFRELGLTPDSLFKIEKVEQLRAEDKRQTRIGFEREASLRRAAEQQKRAAEQRARRNSEERRIAQSRAEKAERELRKVEQFQTEDKRQTTIRFEREASLRRAAEQRARRNSEEKRAAEQRARRNSEEKRAAEQRARRSSEERRIAQSRAEKAERELQVLRQRLARPLEHNNTRENHKRSRPSSTSSDASQERTQSDRQTRRKILQR